MLSKEEIIELRSIAVDIKKKQTSQENAFDDKKDK